MRYFKNARYKAKLWIQTHPYSETAKEILEFSFFVIMALTAMYLMGASYLLAPVSLLGAAIGFTAAASISIMLINLSNTSNVSVLNTMGRCAIVLSLAVLLQQLCSHEASSIDLIIKKIDARPGEAIITLIFGVVSWHLFQTFIPKPKVRQVMEGTTVIPRKVVRYSKVGPWSKLSDWDAQFVAAHEAGHAVALGLFPYLENKCHVTLQMGVDADFLDGYCRVNGWGNKSQSMTFHEIHMIILLAGVEAEFLCMGERGISATSDYDRFLNLARKRLQCDHRGIFFNEPANEHEVRHNNEAILELKARYQNITRNLLAENREILDTIRFALIEKGVLQGQEFRDLVSKVRWVPGCPVISPRLDEALKADVDVTNGRFPDSPAA